MTRSVTSFEALGTAQAGAFTGMKHDHETHNSAILIGGILCVLSGGRCDLPTWTHADVAQRQRQP